MAKFEITSPDGQRFEITAPEGATQEEVLAYAQSQGSPTPAQPPEQTQEQPQAPTAQPANIGDRIAANPLMRFASMAADPFIGAFQMANENPLSRALGHTDRINRAITEMEASKQRGIAEQSPLVSGTGAVAGLAGSILSPAFLNKASVAILKAPTLLGKVAGSAAIGTTAGATMSVADENPEETRGENAAIGLAFGAGIPLVGTAIKKSVGWLWDVATGNRTNIAGGKLLRDVVGDKRAATEQAWKNAPDDLTAAQAAGKTGSYELAALGDVSKKYRPGQFDERLLPQQAGYEKTLAGQAGGNTQLKAMQAQQRAGKDLNAALEPVRKKVLNAANIPMQQKPALQDALAETNRTINHAWQQIRELGTEAARQSSRGAATGVKLPVLPSTGLPGVDASRASQNLSYAARQNADRSLPFIQGVKRQAHYDVTESANAAAVEFAEAVTKAKGTRAVIEGQIGAMPDPISANAIRAAIAKQANVAGDSANPIVVKTLEGFDNFVQKLADKNGGYLDAYDVHGLRKYVNEMVDTIYPSADVAMKKRAAAVINGLKPAIDAEIKRAAGLHGKRWDTWLTQFSDGKHTIDKQKMAAYALELVQKDTTESKKAFIALVRNNDTEAVEKIFGKGNVSLFKNMGKDAKPMLDIAKKFERDLMLSDRSSKSQLALGQILEKDAIKVRLPALVDARIGAANKVIDVIESKANRATLNAVYKAMESPKGALKLLDSLPASERISAQRLYQALRLKQSLTITGVQASKQGE